MDQTVLLAPMELEAARNYGRSLSMTMMTASRKRARFEDDEAWDGYLQPVRRMCLEPIEETTSNSALPPLRTPIWARPALLPSLSEMLRPSFDAHNSRCVLPMAAMPQAIESSSALLDLRERSSTSSPSSSPSPQWSPAVTPDAHPLSIAQEPEDKSPWPTALEYSHLLSNMSAFSDIPVYDLGEDPRGVPLHPAFIYTQPRSCMYFLRCRRLLGRGSFGFPRQRTMTTQVGPHACSKAFEWRKMSFVTGVPKKKPLVRYITATCYSRAATPSRRNGQPADGEKPEKKKMLRMHAVMLSSEDGSGECGDFVLVHIRAGGCKRVGARMARPSSPSVEEQQQSLQAMRVNGKSVPLPLPVEPLWRSPSSYSSEATSPTYGDRSDECCVDVDV